MTLLGTYTLKLFGHLFLGIHNMDASLYRKEIPSVEKMHDCNEDYMTYPFTQANTSHVSTVS